MGFSLGEIFLLVLVGIIVVGPKRLPVMMRTAGQWVGRLRRMSSDLRSQSGIDDLLRQEGLAQHINELRSLSRLNMMETLIAPVSTATAPYTPPAPLDQPAATRAGRQLPPPFAWRPQEPLREREYPLVGCDAYGALQDDAAIYLPTPEPPAAAEEKPATAAEEKPAQADEAAVAATVDAKGDATEAAPVEAATATAETAATSASASTPRPPAPAPTAEVPS